jgi:glutamate-1-semialdehyde 2,1-aminomutase
MAEVLTPEAYARTQLLGAQLADGLEAAVAAVGLPWSVHRFWPRSGLSFTPTPPTTGADAVRFLDADLRALMRVYLANRGVWDALVGAGPTCSVAATAGDVAVYVAVVGELLGELTG